MQRRAPTLIRGAVSGLVLLAVVVGLPAGLVHEVGWPLPTQAPSLDEVAQALRSGVIADATIIKALAVLVWAAWANFALGLAVEAIAMTRRRPARRLAGLRSTQRVAANLLTSASLALSVLTRTATPALAEPAPLQVAVQPVLVGASTGSFGGAGVGAAGGDAMISPVGRATAPGATAGRLYEVERGDTLWDIAQRLLGDGMRWRELRDLNVGRHQLDGRTIGPTDDDIHVGWTLLIPQGPATGPQTPVEDAAATPEAVTVERGDTLWDLAGEHLEDHHRWTEIFDLNVGRTQTDGATLTDPNLIQPGWHLDLPTPGRTALVESAHESASPAPALPESSGRVAPAAPLPSVEPDDHHVRPVPSPQPVPETAPQFDDAEGAGADGAGEELSGVDEILQETLAASALLAGLVLTLDRVRRARLRRRQPGHRIPLPEGDDLDAETRMRAEASTSDARFLDLALRELSALDDDALPGRVQLITYSADSINVHLDGPCPDPPDPWTTDETAIVWTRSRPEPFDELETHSTTPSCFPALVTLGQVAGARAALLNLVAARYLSLQGEQDMVDELLRNWALELATTARADALQVVTVGVDGLPVDLERLHVLSDAEDLADLLDRPAVSDDATRVATAVLAGRMSEEQASRLRSVAEQRDDVVAVIAASVEPGEWRLVVNDGTATLEPLGVDIELVDLPDGTTTSFRRLFQQALRDPDQLVQLPEEPRDPADDLVAALLPTDEPREDTDGEISKARAEDDDVVQDVPDVESDSVVEVAILGPVKVTGMAESFATNKAQELVVYLAMHRDGVDTDSLMEALWHGQEPNKRRLHTEISRARKALGTAPDGAPHFPAQDLGRYRLAPSVVLDHDRFQAAIDAARRDPDAAKDHLRAALELVRGAPLSTTPTEYAWAINETYRLAQEVVDVAYELAEGALEAGRWEDATWAAEQGLRADPMAESLFRILMEAADAAGNTARVTSVMNRFRRLLSEDGDDNDADDSIHPDTLATYERLRRATGGAGRAQ